MKVLDLTTQPQGVSQIQDALYTLEPDERGPLCLAVFVESILVAGMRKDDAIALLDHTYDAAVNRNRILELAKRIIRGRTGGNGAGEPGTA